MGQSLCGPCCLVLVFHYEYLCTAHHKLPLLSVSPSVFNWSIRRLFLIFLLFVYRVMEPEEFKGNVFMTDILPESLASLLLILLILALPLSHLFFFFDLSNDGYRLC
jgi:hypothetical protein